MNSPTLSRLRSGALLGSIVHATVQPRFAAFFEGWFGNDWQLNNWSGTNGSITFFVEGAVGAFYDVHSRLGPDNWLLQNQESFFQGMPTDYRVIAKKITLQYLLNTVDDKVVPLVTAVFWSEGDELRAAVPWDEMMANGGHIINTHLLEPEAALKEWEEGYGMTPAEVKFARRLFERKTREKASWIDLSESEARWLEEQATKAAGMEQCRESFAEIGIFVPCVRAESRAKE
jgi:hypothetical protein